MTSNVKQQYAGSDFIGGNATRQGRGRDAVPAVGHRRRSRRRALRQRLDRRARRRPPGSRRHAVRRDLPDRAEGVRVEGAGVRRRRPIDGLITALRSPAVNVRAIGFEGLKARGAAAVNAVAALLNDPSPYMRGRAIYLLYQLGPEGRQRAGAPESHTDPALRIAAYRAMRRAGLDVTAGGGAARPRHRRRRPPRGGAVAARPAGRRRRSTILVDIARGFDGQDRSYLEALGTGATGKEAGALRAAAARARRARPIRWRGPPTFARIAWRLHVPAAVPDLTARARVVEAVARRPPARARHARLHQGSRGVEGDARARASRTARCASRRRVWLLNRMSNDWADHGLRPALKAAGIYDPDAITLREVGRAAAARRICRELSVDEIAAPHRRRRARQGHGRRAA